MEESKTNAFGERHLTVYEKYQPRSFRGVNVPEIRLCGKWLEDTGFECGQSVTVTLQQNKIIITPATVQEQNPQ